MTGVAVKVSTAELHNEVSVAATVTEGVTLVATVRCTLLLVALVGLAQLMLLVTMTHTLSPLVNDEAV